MSKLDVAKEQIAYLKLWLGILIASAISLTGWLLSNIRSAERLLTGSASLLLAVMGFGCYALHRKIGSKIAELEPLS